MLPQNRESDKPSEDTKLLADAMLGKLCKWLRILGYDTMYDSTWDDNEIVRLARAEGRVVLTRDRALSERRGTRAILIDSDMLEEQLAQVIAELDLPAGRAGSRCSVCNSILETVDKSKVQDRLPRHVHQTQDVFRHCPNCDRIYWQGGHWCRMQPVIERARFAAQQRSSRHSRDATRAQLERHRSDSTR
jgi:uncharacterized protein with PIN domain